MGFAVPVIRLLNIMHFKKKEEKKVARDYFLCFAIVKQTEKEVRLSNERFKQNRVKILVS